jgi:hypothetical protein
MSALGQKRTFREVQTMSAFVPKATHALQQKRGYSSTSSAIASTRVGL